MIYEKTEILNQDNYRRGGLILRFFGCGSIFSICFSSFDFESPKQIKDGPSVVVPAGLESAAGTEASHKIGLGFRI